MTFRSLWLHIQAKRWKYLIILASALLILCIYFFERREISNYTIGDIKSYSVLKTYESHKKDYKIELRKIEILNELKTTKLSAKAKENENYLRVTYRIRSDKPKKMPAELYTFSLEGSTQRYHENFLLNSLNANLTLENIPTAFDYTLSQSSASDYLSDDFTTYDLVSVFILPKDDIEKLRIHLDGKPIPVFEKQNKLRHTH